MYGQAQVPTYTYMASKMENAFRPSSLNCNHKSKRGTLRVGL